MLYLPPWLRLADAERQAGVQEIPGEAHNPRILEYGTSVTLRVTTDEVYWCSNFINWLFMKLGMARTKSARARSWLEWGIPLQHPALGCVAVLSRGPGNQPDKTMIEAPGHVMLLTDFEIGHTVTGIGGNQNDRVCEKAYPFERLLDLRWPG